MKSRAKLLRSKANPLALLQINRVWPLRKHQPPRARKKSFWDRCRSLKDKNKRSSRKNWNKKLREKSKDSSFCKKTKKKSKEKACWCNMSSSKKKEKNRRSKRSKTNLTIGASSSKSQRRKSPFKSPNNLENGKSKSANQRSSSLKSNNSQRTAVITRSTVLVILKSSMISLNPLQSTNPEKILIRSNP